MKQPSMGRMKFMKRNNDQLETPGRPAEATVKTDALDEMLKAAFAEWERRYKEIPQKERDKGRRWLAIRKKAAHKIDPETAEVDWAYGQMVDPYGMRPEPPEEIWQVGRVYFARSPGSKVWVCFRDLPRATRDALWEKHKAKLAFPAGLPQVNYNETTVHPDANGSCVVHLDESTLQQAAKVAEQSAKRREQIVNGHIQQADDANP